MHARIVFSSSILALLVACSGATHTELEDTVAGSDAPTSPDPTGGASGGEDSSGSGSAQGTGSGKGSGKDACRADPSAFDIPGNGIDDDCNGKVDDVEVCDGSLAIGGTDATDAAKALGLCRLASAPNGWGVVSAKWLRLDGAPLPKDATDAFGLLSKMGAAKPQAGGAMLAISSGVARAPGDPGYVAPSSGKDRGYTSAILGGLKPASSLCPDATAGEAHDGVVLELAIRVPSNARSLSFAHQFFTLDYADDVCTQYDDFFAVTMDPKPADRPDGNITVDANGDAISVDSSFVRACAPGDHAGLTYSCPLGAAPLAGTGYEGHASTGWLTTTVGVAPGSTITLRFAIWDSGDGQYDSTALVDGLAFSPSPVTETTTTFAGGK